MNKNTVVAWSGPSQFDGAPTIALLTGLERVGKNPKTGGTMLQTYIIREDINPQEALTTGDDKSVCGGCKHRPDRTALTRGKVQRSCYVQVFRAPSKMHQTYLLGRYEQVDLARLVELGTDRLVRLGSYGDPVAVPIEVWNHLLANSVGHTGYTHAWTVKRFQAYSSLCMASVDTEAERVKARAMGWSTFRVQAYQNELKFPAEIVCPASHEAGRVATCAECMLCDPSAHVGSQIVIQAHGTGRGHVK